MIQQLNQKHQFKIAYFLLVVFCISFQVSLYAGAPGRSGVRPGHVFEPHQTIIHQKNDRKSQLPTKPSLPDAVLLQSGGPSQPEMTSFKSVGTDNLVNLFTGDFNYNIPLMDVGGYPVNIYYDGNIGMEQEASWVGLGWNINPGTINRNMRGIPDDFDGTEQMVEHQDIKPNITWGGSIGGDLEGIGIKDFANLSVGADLGVSFNNYLGPALDVKIKGGVNFTIAAKAQPEKITGGDTLVGKVSSLSAGVSGTLDLSSRDGATFSPAASLTGKLFLGDRFISNGFSASTSYNSRIGIRSLQLSDQFTIGRQQKTGKYDQQWSDEKQYYVAQTRDRTNSANIYSSSITFARPSYIPTIRMPMVNTAWSGHFQLGGAIFGIYGSAEAEVFRQESHVSAPNQSKPLVGYMYYQNAVSNEDAVMDFTRHGDREVTGHTPVISAPEYTYDVFSIQGEGTGGSVRAYRTDLGYIRDNVTKSTDNSWGAGVDIGIPGHVGGNFNIVKTPTVIGKWQEGNNLDGNLNFQTGRDLHELVYFRNPGESSVLDKDQYKNIGNDDLVRFVLGGDQANPTVEPALLHYPKSGQQFTSGITNDIHPVNTIKRSQVVSFLTADEAARAGLDQKINIYSNTDQLIDNGTGGQHSFSLHPSMQDRVNSYRLGHHISQINVTEADGKRYVYGIPVYNITQRDYTFSIKNVANPAGDRACIVAGWMDDMLNDDGVDGYMQSTITPAYAHSFLLSGLLSPDYVDVTGDGISEDDLGNAVKFNYDFTGVHKWRTPLSAKNTNTCGNGSEANLNSGNRTETKDDKGIVSYGEREQWYLNSIESKTMIAIFTLGNRLDGKGATGYNANLIDPNEQAVKLLDHIDLYNKADLHLHGLTGDHAAKPVKTVHFVYNYSLCKGVPDNLNNSITNYSGPDRGKLTLTGIYFTYNGQNRANKAEYKFSYINTLASPSSTDYELNNGPGNPDYEFNASDRWGTYKPSSSNPGGLSNKDFPYSQRATYNDDGTYKDDIKPVNANAGAWALKKILLPSGGQMEVSYESDDYAYVQDKRAAQMMQVIGFANSQPTATANSSAASSHLYDITKNSLGFYNTVANPYVFIRVPQACTAGNLYEKYLEGISQLVFRYTVEMPKGEEWLTAYAGFEPTDGAAVNYGVTSDPTVIWLKLKLDDGYNPLALTALEYLRQQLPGQAFPGYDMSSFTGGAVEEIGTMIVDMLSGLKGAFTTPVKYFQEQGLAKTTGHFADGSLKCFARLDNPAGRKPGGGSRVHSVILKDNWKKMTGQYTAAYGQVYDYTTTVTVNGQPKNISSGVASYEPAIGGEENPFSMILQYKDRLPAGPASYGTVELPMLDALFPSPSVGYSKVTVRSLADNPQPTLTNTKAKSGVGKQVTEFYTARDYPVYFDYTSLDKASDMQAHEASLLAFFHKSAFDSRALSQGFIIVNNDMNGKLKKQSSYSAKDENTMLGYTENYYTNTGQNGMNDLFDYADGLDHGKVISGNQGIDIELMTDARQLSISSSSEEVQAQVDLFPVVLPFWLPFIWPVSGESESNYRAVTTTKVVTYHSVVDKVLVVDKGSQVITRNILRDSRTGGVIVSQAINEFDKPVYSTTYPAYWAYSGMGPAYQNLDVIYKGVNFSDGSIKSTGTQVDPSVLESGDELLVLPSPTIPSDDCDAALASPGISTSTVKGVDVIWAFDKNKDGSGLTNTSHNYIFLDKDGNPYTNGSVDVRVIRSGRRNMLDAEMQSAVNLSVNPVRAGNTGRFLKIDGTSKVTDISAIEYREKWQTDKDELKGRITVTEGCTPKEYPSCDNTDPTFHTEKGLNPYTKGLMGNFRVYRDLVYYGDRSEGTSVAGTNLPYNGFLNSDQFHLYWDFTALPFPTAAATHDADNTSRWTFKSRATRINARGMPLEDIDALGIYTASQFGYDKLLPVAITANANYGGAVYEGFEDNDFNNRLSNAGANLCTPANSFYKSNKYIDFSMTNGAVVSIDATGVRAHTGKNMLMVAGGATAYKYIPVADQANNSFSLPFGQSAIKELSDQGGDYQFGPAAGDPLYWNNSPKITFSSANSQGSASVQIISDVQANITHPRYTFRDTFGFYLNITQSRYYHFHLRLSSEKRNVQDINNVQAYSNSLSVTLQRLNSNDGTIDMSLSQDKWSDPTKESVPDLSFFLCAGIYKVSGYANQQYSNQIDPTDSYNEFDWSCTDCYSPEYKTLGEVTKCPFTVAIAPDASMFNPSFNVPTTGEMMFSAWVHEDRAPNSQAGYTGQEVQVQFVDANYINIDQDNYNNNGFNAPGTAKIGVKHLQAAGPVIDGWQRYVGYFAAPAGAKFMKLSLVNGQGGNAYFDDIRIHPFHANMKSYVYDPVNLRLLSEMDANNYATFYEYDEEGTLIRTKAETVQGIKTITETRSAKQKNIQSFEP